MPITLEELKQRFNDPQMTQREWTLWLIKDMDRSKEFHPTEQQINQLIAGLDRMEKDGVSFDDDACEALSSRNMEERLEWFHGFDGFDEVDDLLAEILKTAKKKYEYFDTTYPTVGWYTVADLIEILKKCPPHAMIIGDGGHCRRIVSEPNANEPFVSLMNAK
jgi:hypothetical protein